jgi:hypothetical protein
VRYTTPAALVNELGAAAEERTLSHVVARYGRLDLLRLDEFGDVHRDPGGAEREECPSAAIASSRSLSGERGGTESAG